MILKDPKDLLQWFDRYTGCPNDERFSLADIHQAINGTPTIEAESVRHGRWMPQVLLGERVWDCSECKTLGSPYWKRCPVCEAKMDLEGE